MFHMRFGAVASVVVLALGASHAHAGFATTIDFSTDDFGGALLNGQIIDSEFSTLFTLSSSGPNDGLVIFDSTSGVNPADPDLWVNTGNLLTLQAPGSDQAGGFFTTPNDAISGGVITFSFVDPVELLSIDLVDVDTAIESATLTMIDAFGNSRQIIAPDNWTGDVSAGDPGIGTLDLTSDLDQPGFGSDAFLNFEDLGFDASQVVTFNVEFAGSAAIDNFTFIPTPSAGLLLAGGLLANGRRRRRS